MAAEFQYNQSGLDSPALRALSACGVSAPVRWLMWLGVRIGGWVYFERTRP